MNRLPSNLIGHEVFVILNSGEELEGLCIQAGDSYLILRIGTWWEYTVEADAIAAIGVDREGKAYGGYPLLEKEVKGFEIGQLAEPEHTTDERAVVDYTTKIDECNPRVITINKQSDRLEAIEHRLAKIDVEELDILAIGVKKPEEKA